LGIDAAMTRDDMAVVASLVDLGPPVKHFVLLIESTTRR
jgi:hypothetical protein